MFGTLIVKHENICYSQVFNYPKSQSYLFQENILSQYA